MIALQRLTTSGQWVEIARYHTRHEAASTIFDNQIESLRGRGEFGIFRIISLAQCP